MNAQTLIQIAAVIGREFTFEVLARACDQSEDALVQGLDELWRKHIVREQGASAYDFSHDKIRVVAYAALSATRRRVLHRKVAEALVGVYASNLDAIAVRLRSITKSPGRLSGPLSSIGGQRRLRSASMLMTRRSALSALVKQRSRQTPID